MAVIKLGNVQAAVRNLSQIDAAAAAAGNAAYQSVLQKYGIAGNQSTRDPAIIAEANAASQQASDAATAAAKAAGLSSAIGSGAPPPAAAADGTAPIAMDTTGAGGGLNLWATLKQSPHAKEYALAIAGLVLLGVVLRSARR